MEIISSFQNCLSSEQEFITDIVYGCFAHQKLLNVVVNVFYDQKGKFLLKADRNQFVGMLTTFLNILIYVYIFVVVIHLLK